MSKNKSKIIIIGLLAVVVICSAAAILSLPRSSDGQAPKYSAEYDTQQTKTLTASQEPGQTETAETVPETEAATTEEPVTEAETTTVQSGPSNISEGELHLEYMSYRYTGLPVTPDVQVTVDDNMLRQGVDYTVSYTENVNAGEALVTVTGKGEYTGELASSFTIKPGDISEIAFDVNAGSLIYNGRAQTPEVFPADEDGAKLKEDIDYLLSYEGNTDAGEADVFIVGIGNYCGTANVKFTILPCQLDISVIMNTSEFDYTGEKQVPKLTVLNGEEIVPPEEYTVTYSGNCTDVGLYEAVVALSGNYSGSDCVVFSILPAKTEISSLRAIDGTSVLLDWNRAQKVNGYEIQYSAAGDWSDIVTVTINDSDTTETVVPGLAPGSSYSFRARSYVNDGVGMLYSGWSVTKVIETSARYERVLNLQRYTAYSGKYYDYWLNVPEGATDGYPLLVFLHGDGEMGSPDAVLALPQAQAMVSSSAFISVVPVAQTVWTSDLTTLKKLIDYVAELYNADSARIYIWGFSRGATGVWKMVDTYPDYFAAAIPVSNEPWFNENPYNFLHTRIWAIAGELETNNWGGVNLVYDMQVFVDKINAAGGNAIMEVYGGHSHGTISAALATAQLFGWLLSTP